MFFFNTGLFSPCIFCSFLHLQTILPHLEFAQWSYVYWEIIWNIGIRQVLNSPAENNGKQDENKMKTNIFLDTALLHVSCFFIWHDPVCWFLPLICRFDGIPNLHNPCGGCEWKWGRDEHKGNDHKDVLRQTVRTTTKRHAWNRKFYGKNLNLNQNL